MPDVTTKQVIQYYKLRSIDDDDLACDILFILTCTDATRKTILEKISKEEVLDA